MASPAPIKHKGERGSSLAWTALVLSIILIPLLTLITDGGRLLTVRSRLQTATDAACEDAAWSAADYRTFRESGEVTFEQNYVWIARAQTTFYQSLNDQNRLGYAAFIHVTPDFHSDLMSCSSSAQVDLLSGAGLVGSPLTISTASVSRIRFLNAP